MTTYYPEMGETAPKHAIITSMLVRNGYRLKWLPEHDAAVRSIFAGLKIRPSNVEQFITIKGETKWAARITSAAMSKLARRPELAHEALLD